MYTFSSELLQICMFHSTSKHIVNIFIEFVDIDLILKIFFFDVISIIKYKI